MGVTAEAATVAEACCGGVAFTIDGGAGAGTVLTLYLYELPCNHPRWADHRHLLRSDLVWGDNDRQG